jgi:D-amino-acid dehydrogenase
MARNVELGLNIDTPLAGALHVPDDETGNCSLFTKQLKQAAQAIGVKFQFGSTVNDIVAHERGVHLLLADKKLAADAVVIAAGVDSALLLSQLGIDVPLYPVKGYSATVGIKDFENAPASALMDEAYKVAIARMGSRIRIAGLADFGWRSPELRESALRTLIKIGDDWFPQAANYHAAQFWCGTRPMLPDGPPLLGATPIKNIFVNIGHGPTGWSMAAGSGKLVADVVSGRQPDIDMDGLTLARFQR